MNTKKTVLIAEDETSLRKALREKLKHAGFTVLEAINGEAGLELAEKEHPDFVLLDIVMPRMDGIEMAKKMRASEWGKNIPIMVLSNLNDEGKVGEAMDASIFTYFVKSDTRIEHVVEKAREIMAES